MKYESLPDIGTAKDQLNLMNNMFIKKAPGTMVIIKTSVISGRTHCAELAITKEQCMAFGQGTKVQDAFPNLSADEREFILNGIVPGELAEWE